MFRRVLFFIGFTVATFTAHFLLAYSQDFPLPGKPSIEKLTAQLTSGLTTDQERAKAIFWWIAHNIQYDCKLYHKRNKKKKGVYLGYIKSDALKTFRRGKSICAGYANLMKYMCDIAGVQCVVIAGFSKGPRDTVGQKQTSSHAWNAIKIDGEWFMCDPTWASGFTDLKCTYFTPGFNEQHFMVDPDFFILTHYPKDHAWRLTHSEINLRDFFKLPVVDNGFYENRINNFYPESGVVRAVVGDTIDFTLSSNLDAGLEKITIQLLTKQLENMEDKDPVWNKPFYYTDLGFSYKYVVKTAGRYKVLLRINNKPTLLYDFYVSEGSSSNR